MSESETGGLLREIRDLLAGQDRNVEGYLARLQEMQNHHFARIEAAYRDAAQESHRIERRRTFVAYLYLFFVVFIAAAIGTHWGR
jgi:hypothetical protein